MLYEHGIDLRNVPQEPRRVSYPVDRARRLLMEANKLLTPEPGERFDGPRLWALDDVKSALAHLRQEPKW